jgi:hypothetical protein
LKGPHIRESEVDPESASAEALGSTDAPANKPFVFWNAVVAADVPDPLPDPTETKLGDMPVFDGLAAAYGCLFITTESGKVVCLGNQQ